MKTRWLIPVALLAAALGYAAGQRCATAAEPAATELFGNTAALEKLLKLTPPQTEQVRALAKAFEEKASGACDRHCAARCDLAKKLFRDDAPADELTKCVDEMSAAYAEQERATLEHLVKLRALLTPEQARTLDKHFAACICEKCAGGSEGGGCCSPAT